jgi:hypothetical protein
VIPSSKRKIKISGKDPEGRKGEKRREEKIKTERDEMRERD